MGASLMRLNRRGFIGTLLAIPLAGLGLASQCKKEWTYQIVTDPWGPNKVTITEPITQEDIIKVAKYLDEKDCGSFRAFY